MKEININIEGFNVNGICVGCLNYNRKMFYAENVKECFKTLADIDVPDGLSIQVCWECLAYVRSVTRFRTQILKCFDILMDYSRKHTFLNAPSDLCHHAFQRLTTQPEPELFLGHSETEPKIEVQEIKEEVYSEKDQELEMDLLKEEDNDILEGNILEPVLDDFIQGMEMASEDDIQLSELRKEVRKDRKTRKRKKNGDKAYEDSLESYVPSHGRQRSSSDISIIDDQTNNVKPKEELKDDLPKKSRKLKNLPPNLVELHTMTEEEMWQVRSADLVHKDFVKLRFKCENCIIGFSIEKLMNYHLKGKHNPKTEDCEQCDVCKGYFLTKDNLSVHRSLHLTAYKCKLCYLTTTLKRVMLKHVAQHTGGVEKHECDTCGKVYSSKSKLSYHKNVCHREKPQCDCCGKVFANKLTLKYHLKILPQNKDDKPKEKLYLPCKGCNKVFHSKKSYRAHVVIHDGLTYPCPICGKLFQWKRNLARHTRNHREKDAGERHECRECGKTFSSRDCYNNHMRLSRRHVHEEQYSHECQYCGKKFATKWCMVDHVDWDHLKKVKYQCSVCFKAFKTAKIMVAHMNNIHEGKRSKEPDGEHLCEICGKSYKTVKRLKGHVWAMHTNRSTTKSFKCKLCPATFTWQTSIYKHTKMMHDKRTKPPRSAPSVKKQEYQEMEMANRMHYFQPNLQPMSQNIGIVPNIV